jgi:squalene monooxygenase
MRFFSYLPSEPHLKCPFRLAPSPALLFYHFFSVAFYSIWVMFTHPRRVPATAAVANGRANGNGHVEKGIVPASEEVKWVKPSVLEYPTLFIKAIHVVRILDLLGYVDS